MRVVHLEDQLLGELFDVVVGLQILLDRSLQGSRDKEVLLLEAQLLALVVLVVGIEDITDGLGQVLLLHGLLVVTLVEGIELEALDGLGIPDAEGVDKAVAVADDGQVVGNRLDGAVAFLPEHGPAELLVIVRGHVAAEVHLLGVLGSAELQGIAVLKPVVRDFLLVAVLDLLLEHAVVITDAAAVGRIVEGGKGIQETCSQTAETAVAERGIGLLVLDGVHLEAQLLEGLGDGLISHQVDGVVAEGAAHQELHGQIDQSLGILIVKGLLRPHPAVDDLVLEGQGGGLEHLLLRRFLHGAAVHGAHVVLHTSLKQVLVKFNCGSFNHIFLTSY